MKSCRHIARPMSPMDSIRLVAMQSSKLCHHRTRVVTRMTVSSPMLRQNVSLGVRTTNRCHFSRRKRVFVLRCLDLDCADTPWLKRNERTPFFRERDAGGGRLSSTLSVTPFPSRAIEQVMPPISENPARPADRGRKNSGRALTAQRDLGRQIRYSRQPRH